MLFNPNCSYPCPNDVRFLIISIECRYKWINIQSVGWYSGVAIRATSFMKLRKTISKSASGTENTLTSQVGLLSVYHAF